MAKTRTTLNASADNRVRMFSPFILDQSGWAPIGFGGLH
jgi:hypothetical protein